jgi:hypothetical protein
MKAFSRFTTIPRRGHSQGARHATHGLPSPRFGSANRFQRRFAVSTTIYLAAIVICCLIAGSGCGETSSKPRSDWQSARIAQLEKEQTELRRKLDECEQQKGFLVLSAGGAVAGAVVLLCVGMASGMKLKRKVVEHETQEARNH